MKSRRSEPSEIERFKAALLKKRSELLQTVVEMEKESLRVERTEEPKVPNHPAEIGTDSYEIENAVRLLETESQILEDINRALDLIEEGAYGRCEACHRRIPVKRLKAIPWARLCLACARTLERSEPTPNKTGWLPRRYVW